MKKYVKPSADFLEYISNECYTTSNSLKAEIDTDIGGYPILP